MIDTSFDELQRAAAESWIGRLFMRSLDAADRARQNSTIVRELSSIVERSAAMTLEDRLRLALLFVAGAVGGYAMLLAIVPPYVATGIPAAWFYGLAAAFAIGAVLARPLAAALPESALARLGRWLAR